MAGFKGIDICNQTLDAWLGATMSLGPATVYVRLFTVTPNPDGTGGTEVSGTGYAALAITNDGSSFDPASGGIKLNNAVFDFGTAGSAWGDIVSVAYCVDDVTMDSGTIIYLGILTTPRTVENGDPVFIPIGVGRALET